MNTHQFHGHQLHIGLRTVKTGLAVTLALLVAGMRDAATPIYAVIGAIGAMSRTLHDSRLSCLTQFLGILVGCTLAYVFVALLPFYQDPGAIGLGLILIITVCNFFKWDYAISLSCIIFVSLCIDSENILWYASNRFIDTSTGLVIAYMVNALIKPYNNRGAILRELDGFLGAIPDFLRERVAAERYPDPEELAERLRRIEDEIEIYEQQTFPHRKERRGDCVYLRGCFRLAIRIKQEMEALCVMDVPGIPTPESLQRLEAHGIHIPEDGRVSLDQDSQVMNYHLNNLLDAYTYLEEMRKEQGLQKQ